MIHAICDFCGKDCGRTATLLTLTSFQNFARYSGDTKPFGAESEPRSYVICYNCIKKHQLSPLHPPASPTRSCPTTIRWTSSRKSRSRMILIWQIPMTNHPERRTSLYEPTLHGKRPLGKHRRAAAQYHRGYLLSSVKQHATPPGIPRAGTKKPKKGVPKP